ncbi:MAG: glycosyltransferase family 4 protein [Anaerolineaceae bacterium]|nr:glycosyltransferase family 4 protein [Anaerolineaceae bacterium]
MKIRLAIQQRVIPAYRAPFLELLAKHPEIELGVIAGAPQPGEMITIVEQLEGVDYQFTKNIHLLHGKFYFCLQPQFPAWVKNWHPDVLVVEANPRYRSTPSALRWMKSQKKPVIGWGLGVPQYSGPVSFIRNYTRTQFLKSFNSMIAYSKRGAQGYVQAGFDPENVYVAMNATAASPTNPPPNRVIWKEDYIPIVLYVGRLQPRKRLDALIKICSQLPEKIQPNLWIVGDGAIRSELESLADKAYSKTKFWGEIFGEELDLIFNQADLFVLPGTGGLAVQQAMAHALPVIVAEGDGTQSDLVTNENGWNIPPNDSQALIDAISSALSSPEKLRQKGLAAYQTVKSSVNIDQMVSVFLKASMAAHTRGNS